MILALASALALAQPLVLQADAVHTISGEVLRPGVVVVDEGRIQAVGPPSTVVEPPEAQRLEGAVLTPGLIDALATAGLTGPQNHSADQDHAEWLHPVQPELRALDGYHPYDPLLSWLRGLGVTSVHAAPSPGAAVGGRSLLAANRVAPTEEIQRIDDGFVLFTLGDASKHRFAEQGTASRMGTAATIRQALAEARDYRERRALSGADRAEVDLGLEALAELLAGERRAILHAHRADDVLTALRLAEEFELDILVAGAAEAWRVAGPLAEARVPVLIGPVMARSWRAGDQRLSRFDNAALLQQAGVRIAFMSGYESYVPKVRVVLWEAAIAAANGLGAERALEALTLGAAEILGVGDQLGSLEVGKTADLVLFDGDPFEYSSHVCAVVVDGELVEDRCR